MEGSKTLFFSSKSHGHAKIISSKFTDSLGASPQKGSPALPYAMTKLSRYVDQTTCWTIFVVSKVSRPAVQHKRASAQWVKGVLSLTVKRPERDAEHTPPSSAEVNE